jgi:pimeloyl-ACP methyl ester carboxylesterase
MDTVTIALLVAIGLAVLLLGGLAIYSLAKKIEVEKVVPPRGAFLQLSCGKLHYLTCGSGPDILMIHGLGGQMGNFDTGLLDDLARDHRVTVIDRPGMGSSTRKWPCSTTVGAQAAMVEEAITKLRLDRPLVVGHSLGGAIALGLALRGRVPIRGLALLAPLTLPVEEYSEAFAGLAISSDLLRRFVGWTFAVPTMIRRPEPVVELIFGPEPVPDDSLVKGGGLLSLRPSHFIETSRDFAGSGTDLPAMARQYANLRVPVRILYGTEDRILDHGYHGGRLVARHPQIGLELVEGAGHMLPVTRPKESAAFIRRASRALS